MILLILGERISNNLEKIAGQRCVSRPHTNSLLYLFVVKQIG